LIRPQGFPGDYWQQLGFGGGYQVQIPSNVVAPIRMLPSDGKGPEKIYVFDEIKAADNDMDDDRLFDFEQDASSEDSSESDDNTENKEAVPNPAVILSPNPAVILSPNPAVILSPNPAVPLASPIEMEELLKIAMEPQTPCRVRAKCAMVDSVDGVPLSCDNLECRNFICALDSLVPGRHLCSLICKHLEMDIDAKY